MLNAADLFCGAGGTSTGLLRAAKDLKMKVELVAINHWDVAIATHGLNHPNVKHHNSDLSTIDPRKCVPGGKLDLLMASPECTHFSNARGGRPTTNQGRASVKYILRWVTALEILDVLIENVPEFQTWGPLHRKHIDGCKPVDGVCSSKKCIHGKPIKNRKGEYFKLFIRKMEAHGYQVKWRVLNAADYACPTTRKRLFIIARKGMAVDYPEPSHGRNTMDLFRELLPWRPAREIIDWDMKGESIFKRKKPLSENTMRRIMAGLKKFGGKAFVIGQQSDAAPRDVDQPVPTVAGAGAIAFVEPFILPQFSSGAPRSVDDPLQTITSTSRGIALIEPMLVTTNWGQNNPSPVRSLDQPVPTVTGQGQIGLAQPFIIPIDHHGMKEAGARSTNEPMATVTGKDRFGLVEPMFVKDEAGNIYSLDILFRMLHPHELAGAMSFPKNYQFQGNREQVVKQIGNAVPVELARALCKYLLKTRATLTPTLSQSGRGRKVGIKC